MRSLRSKLLVTLVLLTLAGLCTWRDAQAGWSIVRNPWGTSITGSSAKAPGTETYSGDPDTQGTPGSIKTSPGPNSLNALWPTWGERYAGWRHWGWVWARYLGH